MTLSMWWRRFDIDAVNESQILQSLVITICRLFIWVVFFTSSIFSSLTDIDMSLIFFIDWLWLLEKVLSREWKLCTMTFLTTQRFNIIQTALNWDLLTFLTFIQTQNRIKRFVVNIMYRWILLSIITLLIWTENLCSKQWNWINHKVDKRFIAWFKLFLRLRCFCLLNDRKHSDVSWWVNIWLCKWCYNLLIEIAQ